MEAFVGWRVMLAGIVVFFAAAAAPAQPPASRVRYTLVQERAIRHTLELPGTVEARTRSLVASEVEGIVAELEAREGDSVRRGEILVRIDTDTLRLRREAASAQLQEAAARKLQAELDLERSRELFESGVLSQSQLDLSGSEFEAWSGRVRQLTAEIARIDLDLERSGISAPFSGVVVAEQCEVGEWIGQGDPVAELLSLHDLEVRVEVPEKHFRNLRVGAEARISFEALPGHEVEGRVSAIVPRANPQARTFPLKLRVGNEEGRIGVGMLARVALPVGEAHQARVVPKDGVLMRGGSRFVYRIAEDDTVERVPVELGQAAGVWVEVKGELAPGARVVTRGNERLRPGQAVLGEPLEYAP